MKNEIGSEIRKGAERVIVQSWTPFQENRKKVCDASRHERELAQPTNLIVVDSRCLLIDGRTVMDSYFQW